MVLRPRVPAGDRFGGTGAVWPQALCSPIICGYDETMTRVCW